MLFNINKLLLYYNMTTFTDIKRNSASNSPKRESLAESAFADKLRVLFELGVVYTTVYFDLSNLKIDLLSANIVLDNIREL